MMSPRFGRLGSVLFCSTLPLVVFLGAGSRPRNDFPSVAVNGGSLKALNNTASQNLGKIATLSRRSRATSARQADTSRTTSALQADWGHTKPPNKAITAALVTASFPQHEAVSVPHSFAPTSAFNYSLPVVWPMSLGTAEERSFRTASQNMFLQLHAILNPKTGIATIIYVGSFFSVTLMILISCRLFWVHPGFKTYEADLPWSPDHSVDGHDNFGHGSGHTGLVNGSGWRATWILVKSWIMQPDHKCQVCGVILLVVVNWVAREVAFAKIITNAWAEALNAIQSLHEHKDLTRTRNALFRNFAVHLFVSVPLFDILDPWISWAFCVSFRNFATSRIVDSYMDENGRAYYQIRLREPENKIDNPDQRISEDINSITDDVYSLFASVLSAVFGFTLWFGIFYHQGGPVLVGLAFGMAAVHIIIQYGCFARWTVRMNKKSEAASANFRTMLMKVRENAEVVALSDGTSKERERVQSLYDRIISVSWDRFLGGSVFGVIMSVVNEMPGLIIWLSQLPLIMSGTLGVGDVMRIHMGYGQCSKVIDFLAQSFGTITALQANSERVDQLWVASRRANSIRSGSALEENEILDLDVPLLDEPPAQLGNTNAIAFETSSSSIAFELENLFVDLPGSNKRIGGVSIECIRGSSLLMSGSSGLGKTSALRVLARLWHSGAGTVRSASHTEMLFLPPICWIPYGTLLEVLTYPAVSPTSGIDQVGLQKVVQDSLRRSQLCAFLEEYDLEGAPRDWALVLSAGEKQRVAFARLFVKLELAYHDSQTDRPPELIAILDESTSALDIPTEAALYTELREELQKKRLLALVSVGHRPTLRRFHDTELQIGEIQSVDPELVLTAGTWQTIEEDEVPWQHIKL